MSVHSSIYRPLRGSEIRVLTIAPELRDGLIDCWIFHVDLDLEPGFYALSYVWGDPNDTVPIYLDGFQFQVTRSLHSALTRFRPTLTQDESTDKEDVYCRSPHALVWWIDAICIRQDDDEEKARELLRMGEIFSTATRVWVWLGLEDGPDDAAARELLKFAKRLHDGLNWCDTK